VKLPPAGVSQCAATESYKKDGAPTRVTANTIQCVAVGADRKSSLRSTSLTSELLKPTTPFKNALIELPKSQSPRIGSLRDRWLLCEDRAPIPGG
jgi:hypothetical protein